MDAVVLGTASSDDKARVARTCGCEHVIVTHVWDALSNATLKLAPIERYTLDAASQAGVACYRRRAGVDRLKTREAC